MPSNDSSCVPVVAALHLNHLHKVRETERKRHILREQKKQSKLAKDTEYIKVFYCDLYRRSLVPVSIWKLKKQLQIHKRDKTSSEL